eukprot:2949582-Rhodomonas_salina.2
MARAPPHTTVRTLRQQCAEAGLATTGIRHELAARIAARRHAASPSPSTADLPGVEPISVAVGNMSTSLHQPTPLFFDLPPPPADCEADFQISTRLCSLPAPFTGAFP